MLTFTTRDGEYDSLGNWAGPRDLFPTIEVDQAAETVAITYWEIRNSKRGQYGCTHEHEETLSEDGNVLRITGLTGLRNDRRRTGGRQQFVYFIFLGDSGHYYTHRARATKGWLECEPAKLLKKLRKVGIGADKDVLQQGDFLLKPANGNALADEEFAHEWSGPGHHRFEVPVLRAWDGKHSQVRITEPVNVHHEAVDGIQHPMITVPPGTYVVGTTAESLRHENRRD